MKTFTGRNEALFHFISPRFPLVMNLEATLLTLTLIILLYIPAAMAGIRAAWLQNKTVSRPPREGALPFPSCITSSVAPKCCMASNHKLLQPVTISSLLMHLGFWLGSFMCLGAGWLLPGVFGVTGLCLVHMSLILQPTPACLHGSGTGASAQVKTCKTSLGLVLGLAHSYLP